MRFLKRQITSQVAGAIIMATYFPFLFACFMLHIHGLRAASLAGLLSLLTAWLGAPLWMRVYRPLRRPDSSFRDPANGNRAQRREQAKRYRDRH